MGKYSIIFILAMLLAGPCCAQTFDAFGGLITDAGGNTAPLCTTPPHQQAATCSRSGTTVTCTVTDGTKYAVNEPILIQGTGTGEDWTYDATDGNYGASLITAIAGNTITLTSHSSGTVASTAGTFTPGRTYTQIVGGAQRFCSPGFNHQFFWETVGATQDPRANLAKYGGSGHDCTAAAAIGAQQASWNFLGVGMDSDSQYDSTAGGTCNATSNPRHPQFSEDFSAVHSTDNLYAAIPQGIKDMITGMDANNVCGIKRAIPDIFSNTGNTTFGDYYTHNLADFANTNPGPKSPYYVGLANNDYGNGANLGTGVTGDFHSASSNPANDCDVALEIALTAPHQAYSAQYSYGSGKTFNWPAVYKDAEVYSKTLSASAPASCWSAGSSTIAPCSWPDFVRNEYTTVAAMNAAWGSTYTTFGSSETSFSGETAFTGAGAVISGSYTTAHTNVTPLNVQVTLTPSGGSALAIGGDCAQFTHFGAFGSGVHCEGTVGAGTLSGPSAWHASGLYPANQVVTDTNGNVELSSSKCTTGSGTPVWAATVGFTTSDGSCVWTNYGASIGAPTMDWTKTTSYSIGMIFINLATGDAEVVTTAGTSGASAPAWPTVLQ